MDIVTYNSANVKHNGVQIVRLSTVLRKNRQKRAVQAPVHGKCGEKNVQMQARDIDTWRCWW